MTDYERVEKAIHFLDSHYLEQPDLGTLARAAGVSPYHFHRLFSRWAGVTPKDFLQFCTAAHAKNLLIRSHSVLESALASGLSGPSRLHDLLITLEGVTPGEYRRRGEGLDIEYGIHSTPFGRCLIGLTERGICFLSFLTGNRRRSNSAMLLDLKRTWPKARLLKDYRATRKTVVRLFQSKKGRARQKIFLSPVGTPFQIKVWEAAMKIPPGHVLSYQQLAKVAGHPNATRAVGSALAHNPISYLIPCHRVIRQTGAVGQYRWGRPRKQALLAWEFLKNHSK